MTVLVAEDRSLHVRRDQTVHTAWVDIDQCRLGNRTRMGCGDVEMAYRRLLNVGPDAAPWPPIVGHWEGERFTIHDGRHAFLASLMLGLDKVLVCWLADAEPAP